MGTNCNLSFPTQRNLVDNLKVVCKGLFVLPRKALTLVGEVIRELNKFGDDHLEEFLSLMEIGMVEAIAEIQARQKFENAVKAELRLVVSNPED